MFIIVHVRCAHTQFVQPARVSKYLEENISNKILLRILIVAKFSEHLEFKSALQFHRLWPLKTSMFWLKSKQNCDKFSKVFDKDFVKARFTEEVG